MRARYRYLRRRSVPEPHSGYGEPLSRDGTADLWQTVDHAACFSRPSALQDLPFPCVDLQQRAVPNIDA
jgi:hypothetical protein